MSALAPAHSAQTLSQPQPAEATRRLYERHQGRIFGYCLSLLGSREEAEDAAQTTFMNAQRGLGRGVVPEYELAWLFKIAQNVCHNRRVASWRRGRVESVRDFDTLQEVLATPEGGGSVSVAELTRGLGAIPDRQRRALLLREWQGLSYREIAAELDVSVPAVETLLFRARRSLGEQLEQGGTARRRGSVAWLAAAFRWLFEGGAAPLKIAGIAATVATTATLAAAPALRDHHRTPAPAKPSPRGRAVPDTPRGAVSSQERRHVARRASVATTAPQKDSPTVRTGSAREVVAPPARSDSLSSTTSPGGTSAGPSGGSAAPPDVSVPDVSVPDVGLPTVSLPDVSLPVVSTLPAVQSPVETPPLPGLPKLP